jgi:hypothetical protein
MAYSNPTYGAVQAILKTKYPDGAIPQSMYKDFPFLSLVKKTTNFDGDFRVVALQNERPQGSSSDFATAQGVSQYGLQGGGGSYKRFQVYRTRHYGILRMDGETMKAAVRSAGALVDLWSQETDGISKNEMADLEFQLFGDGTGIRGSVATGGYASGVITLATTANAVYFNLGMRVQIYSTAGAERTVTSNNLFVQSIDRKAGTVTIVAVPTAGGTAVSNPTFSVGNGAPVATDVIARAGDFQLASAVGGSAAAVAGAASGVVCGIQAWVPLTVTSATYWGLDRTNDPVRLAGQHLNAAGLPLNEALMEAEGQVAIQGVGHPDHIFVNPLDLQNLKKALGVDIRYDRVQSNVAGVSFKAVEYDGMQGPIKIISAPFCPRNKAMMLNLASWELATLGPAPQMLDWDNNDYLRVSSNDQYEVRFGHYGQFICNNPGANIVIDGFGL